MKYKIQLTEKINISDSLFISLVKGVKAYYRKRPLILLLNIILIISSAFINPWISVVISLISLFILPNWKEKEFAAKEDNLIKLSSASQERRRKT